MDSENSKKLKSLILKSLSYKTNEQKKSRAIKDFDAFSLTEIIEKVIQFDEKKVENEIEYMVSDIKEFNLHIGMDITFFELIENVKDVSEKDKIINIVKKLNVPMTIDINRVKDLNSKKIEEISSYCDISRVYVNNGYDESAKRGYSLSTYKRIANQAEKMVEKVESSLSEDVSEKERFMAIYNMVIKRTNYNWDVLNTNRANYKEDIMIATNLESFFNGKSKSLCICAATAQALNELCEMAGIESEYVQGYANGQKGREYHSWVRVKIDGKWYNTDPTWDAQNKNYNYCLKDDKFFYEHNHDGVDKNYNPTYCRNTNNEQVKHYNVQRDYHECRESMSDSYLKNYYSQDFLNQRKSNKTYNPTDYDYEVLNKNSVPYKSSSDIVEKQNDEFFLIKIIKILLGIDKKGKVKIGKNRKEKNISDFSISDANDFIKENDIDKYKLNSKDIENRIIEKQKVENNIEKNQKDVNER